MVCKCYHAERNFIGKIGVCWGTKECEACSCGGDESKCDFYAEKRKKATPKTTNASHGHLRIGGQTMYEELVKRLRNCTSGTVEDCLGCPYQGGFNGTYCMNGLVSEAADAIEQLSKLADAIPHVCECCVGCELEKKNGGCDHAFVLSPKRAIQYLIKLRWIPVSERLIHSGWYLVACNEWGGSAVRKAVYDEATKKWLWPAHGGLKDITKFVTHYMSLPEPPKEETIS